MSASGAAAAAAASGGASAIIAAREAERRRKDCEAFIVGFQHSNATVAEMQSYSDCVRILHPRGVAASGVELFLVKAIVAILLVAAAFGAYRHKRDRLFGSGWVESIVLGGIMGVIFAGLVMLVIAGAIFGLMFIAS